ncbi:MAG: OprO/OprP family phosphate-selective porin [Raineya sp.]|jgi:hypothetical protein|nr:OprO/OprP family phosphate-selective porin [Raineya sp.]
MKKHIIFLFFLLSLQAVAQEKQPLFNYKNGLGFLVPDSTFSLNLRFRVQSRFLMNTTSTDNFAPSSWEARVRRTRLSLSGHAFTTKLTYNIQLSFSRGDMDWSDTDASAQNVSPNVLRDAMIFYRPSKNFTLGFGQGKLPGNRQRVISSGALQFYDRSPVNANFTLDRDFGIFTTYIIGKKDFKTILKTAVSSGEGRNSNSSNAGLAYTARLELLPLGEFTDTGDYFEGDVAREERPKISIAGGYHFNDMAVRTQGQLGRDLFSAKSYHTYLVDFLLKYKGFALSSEYIRRDTEGSPITTSSDGATRNVITGDGINTQISYCFESRWEIAARHSLITPHKDIAKSFNQINQFGLGTTKYLRRHKVKAQFNIFYNHERNLTTFRDTQKNFFGVFQMEVGI